MAKQRTSRYLISDEPPLAHRLVSLCMLALLLLPYLLAPVRAVWRPLPAVIPSLAPLSWPFQLLPLVALP